MIIKVNGIEFDINTKPIEQQQTDILIHWTSLNLESGPPEFYRIHRESPDIRTVVNLFNDVLKDGDCISTHAGMLPAKILIHAIIPGNFSMYERTFFNMGEVIKEYKKTNQVRTVSIYFNEMVSEQIGYFMKHVACLDIKNVKIACRPDQYLLVIKTINKYKKDKIMVKLDRAFVNSMIWIGKKIRIKSPNPKK